MNYTKNLDPHTHARHLAETGEFLRVFIDNNDVTTRCFRAAWHVDRVRGDAYLWKHDASGRPYLENGKPAQEIVSGVMRIEPGLRS